MADWDAALYSRFERERTLPARDLCAAIPLERVERIIDIGCGIGNSTAVLHARYPAAHITGADMSEAMLAAISSDFSLWQTTYCHRMPSHQQIMAWYKGTGLRPYLSVLNPEDAAAFEAEVLAEVTKAYPKQQNGEIIFPFPRFFFTAIR